MSKLSYDVMAQVLSRLSDVDLICVSDVNSDWREDVQHYLTSYTPSETLKLIRPKAECKAAAVSLSAMSPRSQLLLQKALWSPVDWSWEVNALSNPIISRFVVRIPLSNGKLLTTGAESLAKAKVSNLRGLDLTMHAIGAKGAAALALADLRSMETLTLSGNALCDEGVRHLMNGAYPKLVTLNLENNELKSKGLRALVSKSSHMPCLEELNLSWNEVDSVGLSTLASGNFTKLRRLYLSGATVDDNGGAALVRMSRACPYLEELHLTDAKIDTGGVTQLLQRGHFHALRVLNLAKCKLRDAVMDGVRPENDDMCFPNVHTLCLRDCALTSKGSKVLAEVLLPKFPHLTDIDLGENYIDDDGLSVLCGALPNKLRKLVLLQNLMGPVGMSSLASASQHLTNLEDLDLSYNAIGDTGLECLAMSPFPRLRRLALIHNRLSRQSIDLFDEIERVFPALDEIVLRGNGFALRTQRKLLERLHERNAALQKMKGLFR